jgi:hypothetical protein
MGKIASRGLSGDSEHRLAFKVELARGVSHIASTLTPTSTTAAVAEVLDQFIVDRGAGGFEAFRLLLAEDLENRGCLRGAEVVKIYVRKQRVKD